MFDLFELLSVRKLISGCPSFQYGQTMHVAIYLFMYVYIAIYFDSLWLSTNVFVRLILSPGLDAGVCVCMCVCVCVREREREREREI